MWGGPVADGLNNAVIVYVYILPRLREHLQARALQTRTELSTQILIEIGPHDPHTVVGVYICILHMQKVLRETSPSSIKIGFNRRLNLMFAPGEG